MENIERIRPATEPVPGSFAMLARNASDEEKGPKTAPESENRVNLVETEGRIFQARLSYDPENAEVFIEILDPTTGDVIRRFPAEEAAETQSDFRQGGRLVNQVAWSTGVFLGHGVQR